MENNDNQPMRLGPKGLISKQELVKLIIQCLNSLGYDASANSLESQSHISYRTPPFDLLERQILLGDWESLTLAVFQDIRDDIRANVLFLTIRQFIVECVIRGDDAAALATLRKDFSALGLRRERIAPISYIIIAKNKIGGPGGLGDIDDGVIVEMRRDLVSRLEELILAPNRRLECLVEKALDAQRSSCTYHNLEDSISLYEDHHNCGKVYFPTETLQILTHHTDEVWYIQFSNNGEYLASGSSDFQTIIWQVWENGNLILRQRLRGHQSPVYFVSWSPDDTKLLTCGYHVLKFWEVNTGRLICTFLGQSPILSSCAWFPNSEGLIFGCSGPNRRKHMYKFDDKSFIQLSGSDNPMTGNVATASNSNFICFFTRNEIFIQDAGKLGMNTERKIIENSEITSVCVSKDGNHLIVNLNNQEIHVWDTAGKLVKPLVYQGHKQARFVIHSCFGGLDSMFIASGSEDSQVYIWNRQSSKPIEILSGHSMVVNCVSWNPKRHYMLASASDDKTIRIWGPSGMRRK